MVDSNLLLGCIIYVSMKYAFNWYEISILELYEYTVYFQIEASTCSKLYIELKRPY